MVRAGNNTRAGNKHIRIYEETYDKLISEAKYGDTMADVLEKILEGKKKW